MEKLLYREAEAREVLGIGRTTLFNLLRRGELESVLIGRSRRIPAVSVGAYVERLRAEQGSDA